MSAVSNLSELLASMAPVVRHGEYVFVTAPPGAGDAQTVAQFTPDVVAGAEATVREGEGLTLVLRREVADAAGMTYDFVAAWITLTVHSDLAAVGLTAAFAERLGEHRIGCNVIAGFYHDHVLVPADRASDAVAALEQLAQENR